MLIHYIIIGAVQGLTEFLPVSSSGHLVVLEDLLHIAQGNVSFDIIVHLASICAVVYFLRKELKSLFSIPRKINDPQEDRAKVLIFIIVASAITAVIGFAFKESFEKLFSSPRAVAPSLALTGVLLYLTRFKRTQPARRESSLKVWDGLLIGFAQAVAIIPGISRSGVTISAGILRGIERSLAVRLSFLLSIPAIIGAAVFKLKDFQAVGVAPGYLFAAFISAFIFSFLALKLLVLMVEKLKLHYFAYYCWLVALIIFCLIK